MRQIRPMAYKSSDRYFPIVNIQMGGHAIPGHRIRCSEVGCGNEADILDRNERSLPASIIERKFNQKGWDVGKTEKHDICPDCKNKRRIERRTHRTLSGPTADNVFKINPAGATPVAQTIESPKAPDPREMSREDGRIIFTKLNDIYIDETQGYAAPWTDAAVAKDLNTPEAWVASVRDQHFGPARDNSEIRELVKAAHALLTQMGIEGKAAKQLHLGASTMINQANAINANLIDLARKAETITRQLDRIERIIK